MQLDLFVFVALDAKMWNKQKDTKRDLDFD